MISSRLFAVICGLLVACCLTAFAQGQETPDNCFKKLISDIEARAKDYLPCRAESIRSHPRKESHQWIRNTWFGSSNYVTEFGVGVPLTESLRNVGKESRYSALALGNSSYFANITILKDSVAKNTYLLEGVDEKLDLGFPHAIHPVMDSMRIYGIFNEYKELLREGRMECSFSENDDELLVVKWDGSFKQQPVELELVFDLVHSRCLKQSRTYPTETEEIRFEFNGDDVTPSTSIYRGAVGEHKYEWRYNVVSVDKHPDDSSACFLTHYDLPEPEFFVSAKRLGFWKLVIGVLLIVITLFIGIRFFRGS